MIFNSVEYFVFLIIVLGIYYASGLRRQNIMLLAASYLFYGWWDPRFLFLIILSTVIDYTVGLMVEHGRLTKNERLLPVAYLMFSGIFFLLPDWSALNWSGGAELPEFDLSRFFTLSEQGSWIVAGCAVFMLVLNMLYPLCVRLEEERRRKIFVAFSIFSNLAILGFFKYFDFFVSSVQDGLLSLGINIETSTLDIILPVGISFYTFQTLSYTIDIYRRELSPTRDFINFALFVSYFPQLVAGPIERARHLLPELSAPRKVSYELISRGLFLILFGLFKKICIADGVAPSVNSVFNTQGHVSWIDIVAATFLFAVQIFCDFSGYSDIARGTSKLLGIDLMVNFRSPYFSKTPSEFWQRWHISLSSWLRDYLYVPLGGNRGGQLLTLRNLVLTMLLGGLWHGAAWNFILWGAYQGGILLVYRVLNIRSAVSQHKSRLIRVVQNTAVTGIFFLLVCYGWLLFRAGSLDQVMTFTYLLFADFGNMDLSMKRPTLSALAGIPILMCYEFIFYLMGTALFYKKWPEMIRATVYALIVFLILMGTSNEPAQFIYFQF